MLPTKSLRLDAYLAWINTWLSTLPPDTDDTESIMSVDEMASFFQEENLLGLLKHNNLKLIIASFRQRVHSQEILLGGRSAPSCDATSILNPRYDPRAECSCDGIYPVPLGATLESSMQHNKCTAVEKMVDMANLVNAREDEWNPGHIFTADHLRDAVAELVLSAADEEPIPESCLGPTPFLSDIQAPDRRPDPMCDTELSVYHQLYPTNEQIKLLADAKYFFAIACGGGFCDDGLAKAVAEAANSVLIADYCEAADEKSLFLLQEVGAAATAFLKLCDLAGVITDWQFDNNVAQTIQFQVLGYYRDHSRHRRPNGVYGSRMTDMLAHRYIDLSLYIGVMNASIGLGEQITREQFQLLAEACCYINDLIDFRSDTMRRLRENVILRGV